LQLIVKTYQNSFSIFYAKINRKMIGYFGSKVVLEPTSPFTILRDEAFDPNKISDKLFALLLGKTEYVPLTKELYEEIMEDKYRY